MSSYHREVWQEWIDDDLLLDCTEIKFKKDTPKEILIKYNEHLIKIVKESAEDRAFLRNFVINEIHNKFEDGIENSERGITLSSTAMIDLIENYNEEGELISINKVPKDLRKEYEKDLNIIFNIDYDFRRDTKELNVNIESITLKKYHMLLWRKMLPNGKYFLLHDCVKTVYLFLWIDKKNNYPISSYPIAQTYLKLEDMDLIKKISKEEFNSFLTVGNTIGGFIIFPSNKIDDLPSISEECNTNSQICNRFDIILECIRRYYNRGNSPLQETIKRYKKYFNLFTSFKGFCEFFFLQDITSENYKKIDFFLPFKKFEENPFPKTVDEYMLYKNKIMNFIRNRNVRIAEYVKSQR